MPDGVAGTLSEAGRADRRKRRLWAVPGSRHDRIIAVLRVVLPAGAFALAVVLAVAPITSGTEISFVLSKNRVAVASERMRVASALYRGEDNSGQPFALTARSAVQAKSSDPVVRLDTLNARIGLQNGPATLSAPGGKYDTRQQTVALSGPVRFRGQDGYRIDTRDVDLDMRTRALASRAPVTGQISLGDFSAERMQANLDDRTVVLTGNARLHIPQGQARARK